MRLHLGAGFTVARELCGSFTIYYNVMMIIIIIIEIKCSINVMSLNHPETIPPTPVHGNIVFHKTDPWCQINGGHCGLRGQDSCCPSPQESKQSTKSPPPGGWGAL